MELRKNNMKSKTFLQLVLVSLIAYGIYEFWIPFYKKCAISEELRSQGYVSISEKKDYTFTNAHKESHAGVMNDSNAFCGLFIFLTWLIIIVATIVLFVWIWCGELSELIDPYLDKIKKWLNRRNEPNEKQS